MVGRYSFRNCRRSSAVSSEKSRRRRFGNKFFFTYNVEVVVRRGYIVRCSFSVKFFPLHVYYTTMGRSCQIFGVKLEILLRKTLMLGPPSRALCILHNSQNNPGWFFVQVDK